MNTVVTSREQILAASRKLIAEKGWAQVNIRSVAAACGVSVGSIYNYFSSKYELVCATVESVWCDIFHKPEQEEIFFDTERCVAWLYERMRYGCEQYPQFFTIHSMAFLHEEKADGKMRMQQTWQHILEGLCLVMRRDQRISAKAFDENFTVEQFADVLFSLMISALVRQDYNPDAVLEIVRRTLYFA